MKKLLFPILGVSIFLLILTNKGYCQHLSEEKQITTFGSRIRNPITVKAKSNDKRVIFTVNNSSFYAYELKINFKSLVNLTPLVKEQKFIINAHARNSRIFDFTIRDPFAGHNYQYNISYRIHLNDSEPSPNLKYLIPTEKNERVNFNKLSHSYVFDLNTEDTIYAMRKGYVTATTNPYQTYDKISKRSSIEVMHEDGTIAIYSGIDFENILITAGTTIYPGQPIGIFNSDFDKPFSVSLFRVLHDTFLCTPIDFYTESPIEEIEDYFRIIPKHPEELIKKELSRRELRRFKKNKLYKRSFL